MHPAINQASRILCAAALLFLAGCSIPPETTKKADSTALPAADDSVAVTAPLPQRPAITATREESTLPDAKLFSRQDQVMLSRNHVLSMVPAPGQYSQQMVFAEGPPPPRYLDLAGESYNALADNPLTLTRNQPLSTFSIDVDTASYANVRRFLTSGSLPPPGAVRIEEMINYFSYAIPQPKNGPIALVTELGPCPWQPENRLVRIGLKAKELEATEIPPANLIFLVDVSGSMNHPNKLPLARQALLMLSEQLTARDRIGIVTYAGSSRVVLPPTAGDRQMEIKAAIVGLAAGGSTHGSGGIRQAYQLARDSFMPGGNNRVILASDGDFNVGVTSRDELERLIVAERQSGVFLTVLGFGMGNYHDDTMEILADKGNGNYSYIDTLLEAKKVLVKERASTLYTLAKDVKLQVEFNPALVGAYRLLGYENRALAAEDFHDDRKDAGELGVGHTVTALYELYPPDSAALPLVDDLKYQQQTPVPGKADEVMTVKLRYKPIDSDESLLITRTVANDDLSLATTSDDFRFAAAVAGFGMLLRRAEAKDLPPALQYPAILELARAARGEDYDGYRAEFARLVEMAAMLR